MTVLVLSVIVVLIVTVTPLPLKKISDGKKSLRNVIITSFGEMPYEPVQSGGYYQSDIIPINHFNDDIQQETMDVALRTGILVEDPNEKANTDEAETSVEEGVVSSNTKRQTSKELSLENNNDFLHSQSINKRSRSFDGPQVSQQKFNYPQNFFRHHNRESYKPNPPQPQEFSDINNRPYEAELGEGWNVNEAEKRLKGKNYNFLTLTPQHRHPYNYPEPELRESPPPVFLSQGYNPLSYSLPNTVVFHHRRPVTEYSIDDY